MNSSLREKAIALATRLGVEDRVVVDDSVTDVETAVAQFVSAFDEHPYIFRKFLYPIFDQRFRAGLRDITFLEFDDQAPVKKIFPARYMYGNFKALAEKTGLVLPEPTWSTVAGLTFIGLFFLSCGFALWAIIWRPEILFVLFGFIKSGFVLLLLLIPSLIVCFLFPKMFTKSSLGDIHTYQELIEYVVRRNYYDYYEHEYRLTREVLRTMLTESSASDHHDQRLHPN